MGDKAIAWIIVAAFLIGALVGAITITPSIVAQFTESYSSPPPEITSPQPTLFGIPIPSSEDAEAAARYREDMNLLRAKLDAAEDALYEAAFNVDAAVEQVPELPINFLNTVSLAPAPQARQLALDAYERSEKLQNVVDAQRLQITALKYQNDILTESLERATDRVDELGGRRVRWGPGVTAGCGTGVEIGGDDWDTVNNCSIVVGLTLMWG